MEKKKGIPHAICEKIPVLAVILGIAIPFLIAGITDSIGESLFGNGALHYLFTAFMGIVILALVRLWFLPAYKGAIKLHASAGELIRLLIPFFVYVLVSLVMSIIFKEFGFAPSLTKLCMGLAAGFGEEAMFRSATIPIGLGYIKSEKKVAITLGISCVVFGLLHLANIGAGGAPAVIALQAFATMFMGLYFAMLFICSGSILIPIIVHSFWDFYCFTTDITLQDGIMMQESITLSLLLAVLVNVAIGISAIVILYKNYDKIMKIWNEKWSK
ncbi:CPBP family intramembrane glutamic endopeptidase [Butyrivibrio sp. YAB3001]|uniref:CPBP family intramembrane glutamic endopeptidase n=1 Tax=Butyrivibrio sp. YAB3001 TaxID=1520812 RepID=UPI0008F635F9|nr:CPBP family intramembrane glutamic endopeptidase [Butyrivibrio sp. YAB3001]SFC49040.1 CAAX protease self-immunity [Butyrivibrio sp. YAB3001]